VLRDRIGVNILRVRLPLKVVNTAARRATLTAFYYGWVLVGVLGATEVISWGVLYYAFSVFLTPMETDLGWSRAETTGAFSLALVLSGFAAIAVGRWLDRRGARVLMTVGSCAGVVLVLPGPRPARCSSSTSSGLLTTWLVRPSSRLGYGHLSGPEIVISADSG
jgi:MFS family permease